MSERLNTKVVTGTVRISYANIWQPKDKGDGKPPKYSASFLVPKTDKETYDKIAAAFKAAKSLGSERFGSAFPKSPKFPLRDGDTDESKEDDPDYKGHWFINSTSVSQPGIVDMERKPIKDSRRVYSGCYVVASLNLYPFMKDGNKGVACGLNHVMLISDGDLMGGRTRPQDDFAGVDVAKCASVAPAAPPAEPVAGGDDPFVDDDEDNGFDF